MGQLGSVPERVGRSLGGGPRALARGRLSGAARRSEDEPLRQSAVRRNLRPARVRERNRVALPALAGQDQEFSTRTRRAVALRQKPRRSAALSPVVRAASGLYAGYLGR